MTATENWPSATANLPATAEVVVVGAGLAGLATAIRLQRRGLEVLLVDAADAPGGRVRTDVVDGFRFDRGFQLYNPAYPEGARMFDHEEAQLRPFTAGAAIALNGRRYRLADPRRRPQWLLDSLRAHVGGLIPMARLGAYAGRCSTTRPQRLATRPDISIKEVFDRGGMTGNLQSNLLQPFLAGVFLEDELATSRRFADLILRSFVRGTPAVPALGMQHLPEQLAGQLPAGALFLNTEVTAVAPGRVETNRGTIRAELAVVVAVGPAKVTTLLPAVPTPVTRACTTWYHRPPAGTVLSDGDALLTLAPAGSGPLVNSAVMTNTAPDYAPPGETLVSSTALGLHGPVDDVRVRRQLAAMYLTETADWELLACYPIEHALPAMTPPLNIRQPVALGEGLFVAGDHRDTASIQGALVSGRRAADAVLVVRL